MGELGCIVFVALFASPKVLWLIGWLAYDTPAVTFSPHLNVWAVLLVLAAVV